MIREFREVIIDNLSDTSKVQYILENTKPNLRKFLFPKVIERCIQIDKFDSLRELVHAYLHDSDYNTSLLMLAVKHDDISLVRLLLENYFDPNIIDDTYDISPLMIATKNNNVEIAQLLLEHGADPHYKTKKNGFTAKMISTHYHYNDITKLLSK